MEDFLVYILKASVCITLFYVCFKAFLSNETFFRFNRNTLLLGMMICMFLPLIQINIPATAKIHTHFALLEKPVLDTEHDQHVTEMDNGTIATLSGDDVMPVNPLPEPSKPMSIGMFLIYIYLSGVLVSVFILVRSFGCLYKIIKRGVRMKRGQYVLIMLDEELSPFSWGKYVIMSRTDYLENHDEIFTHEIAHIQHRHSWDILYIELLTIVQWFNPVLWLLKRELKDIHEYQADISVLKAGIDATKYQLLLVKKAVGTSSYTLANSFNHSKIKKRITMMLKSKSNKWARLKLILILPAAMLSLYAFAHSKVNDGTLFNSKINQLLENSEINDPDFCLPLKAPFKISSAYGAKKGRFHRGVDLRRRGKDTIYAVSEGIVTFAGFDNLRGNYIKIKHDNGFESLYSHSSKNMVAQGDKVKKRQAIAITGSTGKSTGDHLHFELIKDGENVDPTSIIDFSRIQAPPPPPLPLGSSIPRQYLRAGADGKSASDKTLYYVIENKKYALKEFEIL